jgi:hypothetical protein
MPEDRLTHDERLRLECIAQAIALHGIGTYGPTNIVHTADIFAQYVRDGAEDPQ